LFVFVFASFLKKDMVQEELDIRFEKCR